MPILRMKYATRSFCRKRDYLTLFGQIIAYFETAYPPFNRHMLAQVGNVLMNVSPRYTCYPDDN